METERALQKRADSRTSYLKPFGSSAVIVGPFNVGFQIQEVRRLSKEDSSKTPAK